MIISEIFIKGFGIFSEQFLNDLPKGIILFSGDNESGKSTLKRFLKAALYGMAGKKGSIDKPLGKGAHGGILRLIMENGINYQFTLKGRKLRISDRDGKQMDLLPGEIFGGVDEKLFSRIFCLGLEDLWDGEDRILDEENLRSRIFAASSGLGHFSIVRALSGLKEDLAAIARWTGARKDTLLDQIELKLLEVHKEITELGDRSAIYLSLQKERKVLTEEIEDLQQKIRLDRSRNIETRTLENLVEPFQSLSKTEARITELEKAEYFPPGGMERFRVLKDRLLSVRAELDHLLTAREELEGQLSTVRPSEKILGDRLKVEEMADHKVRLEEKLEKLAELRSEKRQLEGEISSLLDVISMDWDMEDLEKADLSMTSSVEAEKFRKDLALIREKQNSLMSVLQEIDGSHEELLREYNASRHKISVLDDNHDEPGKDELEQSLKMLQELEYLSREHDLMEERIEIQQSKVSSLSAELEKTEDMGVPFFVFPMYVPVAFMAISVLLFFYFSYYGAKPPGSSWIFPGTFFLMSLGLFVWRSFQKKRSDLDLQALEKRTTLLREDIHLSRNELTSLFQQSGELKASLQDHCDSLGLDMDFSSGDLDLREEALKRSLARVALLEEARTELIRLHGQLRKSSTRKETLEKELLSLREEEDLLWLNWKNWLEKHFLPLEVTPDLYSNFRQDLTAARKLNRTRQEIQERIRLLEEYVNSLDSTIADLLGSWGRESRGGLPDRIGLVLSVFREEEGKKDLLISLKKEMTDLQERSDKVTKEEEIILEGISELFQAAGVSDEDGFFHLHQDHQTFLTLKERAAQLRARLAGIAGSEAAWMALTSDLENCSRPELEKEILHLGQDLEKMEKDLAEKLQRSGELENRIDQLSLDKRNSVLLQEQELLKAEASRVVRKWMTLALTRGFLEKAVDIHEKQRQPQVISRASGYLGTITGGRYALHSSLKDRAIILEEKESRSYKGLEAWSSGLADQAYIAVRLALADQLNRKGEALPMILDDVHVRFDKARQAGFAEVLLDLSSHRQIFLFSCDSSFQKILRAAEIRKEGNAGANILYCDIREGKISLS